MDKRPILIVEDDIPFAKMLDQELGRNGFKVHLADTAKEALNLIEKVTPEAVVAEAQLPDMNGLDLLENLKNKFPSVPVILMTGGGKVSDAVEAMRKGAEDYLLKPFAADRLEAVIHRALFETPAKARQNEASPPPPRFSSPIITQDRRLKEILDLCRKVAASKATILIQGESGTGKELLARFLHLESPRRQGPFVAVNCASLPETLLESELFGHEKGSFTGAVSRKIGKFELAHRGTILLDEIGEMNTFLQAKILRVLQENEVDRIGGNRPIPIDIRVVATTNRDLPAAIQKGDFREDLFYRLNVIGIHLPPLRERKEDIEFLAQHFLKKFAAEYHRPVQNISAEAMARLKEQEWRGNVRELKNALERAVLITSQSILGVQDFGAPGPAERVADPEIREESLCLREMEQKFILGALEKTQGNRTHAAKILGISIRTLRNKLNEYKQECLGEEKLGMP
jgi:two-component system response regulator FlrC